jgi:hypothetical protein
MGTICNMIPFIDSPTWAGPVTGLPFLDSVVAFDGFLMHRAQAVQQPMKKPDRHWDDPA